MRSSEQKLPIVHLVNSGEQTILFCRGSHLPSSAQKRGLWRQIKNVMRIIDLCEYGPRHIRLTLLRAAMRGQKNLESMPLSSGRVLK